MAGLIDTYTITLRPDWALLAAYGELRIILTALNLEDYKGKLIFHTSNYVDQQDRLEAWQSIAEMGFSPDSVLENSFLGWGKVTEIKKYNAIAFAADEMLHLSGNSLNEYLITSNLIGSDIYGVVISEPHHLARPVKGLYESQYMHSEFWVADTVYEQICYKLVLKDSQAIPSKGITKVG